MLDPETQKKIEENNKQISSLLQENEMLLRQAGFDPPMTNVVLPQEKLIQFPNGYIRRTTEFSSRYHLTSIFANRHSRQNITYALEVSDLMNYVVNRLNIWGPVKTVFYKLAIVNLVSIMEAILLEAANNICQHANQCKGTGKCRKHFNKDERNNARKALEKLVLIDVLDFDEAKVQRTLDIIELRNRIHIRLTPESELKLGDFNLKLYNEVILLLQDIDKQVFQKGVPLYGCAPF